MSDRPVTSTRGEAAVPVVVAVVAALVAGTMLLAPVLGLSGGSAKSADAPVSDVSREGGRPPVDPDEDPFAKLARREPHDPMALGDVDAPVVMIAYSDFQCPFCGKFARDTEPKLVDEYVEDGTLRIEWRDFPYLGAESTTAARAARAAAAQGKFWEFHDALYAHQQPPNSGRLTPAYLTGVARRIGLDARKLRADLTSDEVAEAVRRDFQEGQSIGVTGTPAFLVNGRPIMGAQPLEVFEDAIDHAADQAR